MSETANSAIQLTPRNIQIILMVYEYDGIPSFLIRKRFWPSFGARSYCFDRLLKLVRAGYLRAKPLPSLTGKGTGPRLLTIGPASHPILQRELALTSSELRRLRHSFVPLTFIHECRVREFRLMLETACQGSPQVSCCDWTNESAIRKAPYKVALAQETVELVPDGVFTLTLADGRTKTYYLEFDRATETSQTRFKRRLLAYFAYIGQSGSPVLLVVPTRARLEQLASWINAAAAEMQRSPNIFALALQNEIRQTAILSGPIWWVAGADKASALLPEPQARQSHETVLPGTWIEVVFGQEGSL
jgi:Replication-relaxation